MLGRTNAGIYPANGVLRKYEVESGTIGKGDFVNCLYVSNSITLNSTDGCPIDSTHFAIYTSSKIVLFETNENGLNPTEIARVSIDGNGAIKDIVYADGILCSLSGSTSCKFCAIAVDLTNKTLTVLASLIFGNVPLKLAYYDGNIFVTYGTKQSTSSSYFSSLNIRAYKYSNEAFTLCSTTTISTASYSDIATKVVDGRFYIAYGRTTMYLDDYTIESTDSTCTLTKLRTASSSTMGYTISISSFMMGSNLIIHTSSGYYYIYSGTTTLTVIKDNSYNNPTYASDIVDDSYFVGTFGTYVSAYQISGNTYTRLNSIEVTSDSVSKVFVIGKCAYVYSGNDWVAYKIDSNHNVVATESAQSVKPFARDSSYDVGIALEDGEAEDEIYVRSRE